MTSSCAALVVTHGGHGTLMHALAQGLPMVIIPGMAVDQPINAAAIEAWGVGRALPGDATAHMMRSAVQEVLAAPSLRATARELAQKLVGVDGAANAAAEIEQWVARPQAKAC
jgi:UDP:flavonoid glycosyltransferase YjiC (YdhE family)